MAQLKSLLVSGPTRLIGDSFANKIELTSISAPKTSGGTEYSLGTNGQVLKSNGSSVYWTSLGNVSTLSYGSDTTKYLRNDGNWSALPTANNSTAGITKLGASGGAATYGHIHGNLTNDGKIGTTTDYAVYTTTGGAITAGSLAVTAPTASGTATAFISSVSQNSKGQISASKANLPTASTSTAGIIQIGTGATNAAAGNHTHTTSLATDTGTATVTLAHNTTYKLTAGGTSVIFKMPSDNNTDTKVTQGTTTTGSWRKILLNGGSDTVYSAWNTEVGNDVTDITYRTFGVAVQPSTNTLKATNLEADKTVKVGTFTIGGNTDELTKTISSSSTIYVDRTNASVIFKYNGTNKIRIDTNNYLRPEADNTLQLGDSSYRWNKIYGTNIYGALTGNVTGNVSGSSGSCTGNAATATEFSSNATVKLTGDVTGETSAKKGWTVATTLASITRTNNTSTASPSHGGNFTVIDSITTDTKGRVTAVNTKTVTLPSDNNTWNALSTSQAGYVSQAPNDTTKFLRGDATWARVSEASLAWGGKNFAGDYGCIDAAMVDTLGANRLMFLKPNGITIEYSRDNGSTWTNYEATDSQKRGLFAAGYNFTIGKADSTNKATANGTNYQLRVTINTGIAQVYTALNKFVFYVSTNGSNNCTVTIQKALQSTPSTYVDVATNIPISGWSGYNVINVGSITTYGNTASSQYGRIRFLFKANGGSTSYNGLTISQIMGFGGVGWTTPSTMAKTGHLYSYDNDLNATFPAKVTATSFSGNADSATKLKDGRTFQIKDADNTNAGNASSAFDGQNNLIINLPSTIKATLSGNAATATTAGNVTGTVAVANGGTGNTSMTANRLIYSESASKLNSASSLYATTTGISVNNTSLESGYNFQVTGKSYLNNTTAASTSNTSSQLVVSNSNGGTVAVELWRNGNASWQLCNDSGTLYLRNNYTTAKQSTYSQNGMIMDYNTSNASFAGKLSIGQTDRNTDYQLYVNSSVAKSIYLNTSHATASGKWNSIIQGYAPNMAAGSNTSIGGGQAASEYNSGFLQFHYTGSGSTSNYIGLGLNGHDYLFRCYGTGNVSIGADNNNYKLYVNGTSYHNGNDTHAGNINPEATNTRDLGSSTVEWANIYATTFHGELDGNAATATKATKDSDDNTINTTYLKLSGGTMTGTLYTKSVAKDNFIITPDKYFATTYSTVGAIKIKLPVSWSSTSMSMKVDIYNYNDDNAITYTIGGYNGVTSGGRWKYCSASCYGFGDKSNLKVRFGHDGSKCCIIIGEIDTSWSSPKIIIRDVLLDFDATTVTIANWATGWDIEWITSLPSNISVIKENTNITYNFPKKDGTGATGSWGIDITGNAATATKLATPRNLKVKLDSTTAVTFDGNANQEAIPVTGTLPVANGGTGATTFTSGDALIGNGTGAITTRGIKDNTTVGNLGWTQGGDTTLVTTNTIAYWNGYYGNSNHSNLKYSVNGEIMGLSTAQTVSGTKTFTAIQKFTNTVDSTHSKDTTAAISTSGGISVEKQLSAKSIRIDNNQASVGVQLIFNSTTNALNFVFA